MTTNSIDYFLIVTTLSAFARLTQSTGVVLEPKLDAPESLIEPLAEDICLDLKIFQHESTPLSREECLKNFIYSHEAKTVIPPALHVRCRHGSKVGYSLNSTLGEGTPLVVLTAVNLTLFNLPYNFMMSSKETFGTINIDRPGHYQSWVTLLYYNGSHTYWRKGPDIVSWNMTGEIRPNVYEISVKTEYHTVNGTSKVRATFHWKNFDDEDVCFNFVNNCDGRTTETSTTANMEQSYVASGLPLRANCTAILSGKYGVTRYKYRTPSCGRMHECLVHEKANNLSVKATPAATGWNVTVEWMPPYNDPQRYNVTFFSENLVSSLDVPGNETTATFVGVEDGDYYDVAVGAVYDTRTAYTSVGAVFPDPEKPTRLSATAVEGTIGWNVSVGWAAARPRPQRYNVTLLAEHLYTSLDIPGNETSATFVAVEDYGPYDVAVYAVYETRSVHASVRASFPEIERTSALGTVLGGSWSALLGLGAVLAALFLLWRRRAAKLNNAYFPEPEDKLPKDGICETVESESGAEDMWEIRPERLLLHEVVGEGAFGVVRRATLTPAGKEVAVKMLKDFPTLDEIRSFRAEMELMKSVGAHPHIVSLVGCCSGRRPLIVAEYCARGDLLSYLRCSWDVMVSKRNAKYYNNNIDSSDYRNDLFKCKPHEEHSKLVVNKLYDLQGICDTELTTRDLLSFCRQIAMGMEFLASNRLVHRDLAARNVLVAKDRTLKITDFGLSRDVYEENQYKQKGNGKMPMKWMALESLTHRIYTSKSDVWSFGVVMWEVGSIGASPYAGVAGARLPRLLRAGYRMPRPKHCPKQLYDLMLLCWSAHPRDRPSFSELHTRLDELLNRACAGDYLRLDLEADPAPPLTAHRYVRMIIKSKLGWTKGETYERPLRAVQSNHYSSPPASLVRAPV